MRLRPLGRAMGYEGGGSALCGLGALDGYYSLKWVGGFDVVH